MRLIRPAAIAGAVLMTSMLAACGGSSGPRQPIETSMTTNLMGAQEVPPVNTVASGRARTWYNRSTNTLTWAVDHQGLSGPATGAHFHGPAAPGANAGVVIPIATSDVVPWTGAAVLTSAQQNDLLAGRWYVNVHTAANPGGEIRGQLTP